MNYWPSGILTLSQLALIAKSLDTPAVDRDRPAIRQRGLTAIFNDICFT